MQSQPISATVAREKPISHLFAAPSSSALSVDEVQTVRLANGFLAAVPIVVAADAIFLRGMPYFVAIYALIAAVAALTVARFVPDWIERRMFIRGLTTAPVEGWSFFTVFTCFLAFYAVCNTDSPFNEQVLQADAFLHGHTYLNAPPFIEHLQLGNFSYALHPPLSALLMMPLVAIWGPGMNETAFSVVVGALDIALCWRMLGRFELKPNTRAWLTIFFAMGTIMLEESTVSNTWSVPMIVAVMFTLLALNEVFGRGRPLWVGLWAALACLARYDLALAAPVYPIIMLQRGRKFRELFGIAPAFIAVGLFYLWFNEARFHTLMDVSVSLEGPKDAPAFSPRYFWGNFYTVFCLPPTWNNNFPYLHPQFTGTALIFTSPAFILAMRATWRRLETWLMWLAVLGASTPSLLCYANGFAQFGTRHYVPTFPFLMVLMAIGAERELDQLGRILITLSVIVICAGMVHIRYLGYA